MITIDDAIHRFETRAIDEINNVKSIETRHPNPLGIIRDNVQQGYRNAEEYQQIADWLKDYKRLKEDEK